MELIPHDGNRNPVQVLTFDPDHIQALTTSGTSQTLSIGGGKIVTLTCDADCYITVGGTEATATADHWPLYAEEKESFFLRADQTHVAVIQKSAAGLFRVLEHGVAE